MLICSFEHYKMRIIGSILKMKIVKRSTANITALVSYFIGVWSGGNIIVTLLFGFLSGAIIAILSYVDGQNLNMSTNETNNNESQNVKPNNKDDTNINKPRRLTQEYYKDDDKNNE